MVFTINKNVDITHVDVKERVWKQMLISFLASLPFLTHGVETINLSSSPHSGHFTSTPDDVPWSSTALIISAGVSAPFYCFLIDRWGRRSGIYVVSLVQGASCIPLFLPSSDASVIVLHVFAGLASGGLFTVLPIFIREISSDRIRGLTLSFTMSLTALGYMIKWLLGAEEIMFLMVALVACQFLSMFIIVESPAFLVKVGKVEEAKINIGKLKCLSADNPALATEVSRLKDESDRAKSSGDLTVYRILKNPLYRDGFKIGFVLYTTIILSGSIIFLDQEKTLEQLRMTIDSDSTLTVSCIFGGSLCCLAVILFLDRKHMLTVSFSTMSLSMGVLAVYTQADLTVATLRLVPQASLGVLVFAYGVAWGLPTVVAVEILNMEIRAKILGILFTYSQVLKLAHVHSFKHIEDYMGIYTLLYIFACVNLFGAVYSQFIIPNIKDRTVKQIERQLKRVPLLVFNTKLSNK